MPKNIKPERIAKLLDIMEGEFLTSAQFLKAFEDVIKFVKKMDSRNNETTIKINGSLDNVTSITEQKTKEALDKIGNRTDELIDKSFARVMDKKKEEIKQVIKEEILKLDGRLLGVENKPEFDDVAFLTKIEQIIEEKRTKDIKKIVPQTGEEIKHRLLEETFGYKEVNGLPDVIEDLKKRIRRGGGGFSKIALEGKLIDDETPTGTINGTNKAFTLASTPNPTASLKVYRGGARQRVTEDYTLSGDTITFTVAPVTGEILLCDYRI